MVVVVQPAVAQIDVGSTGVDGVLDCTALGCPPGCDAANPCSVVVDLSLADTGAGRGHYDAVNHAVVFNYTSIDIPSGVTITFKNHPTRAPVMWLSQGDVAIAGTVNMDGDDGGGTAASSYAEPGPGGFRGGRGSQTENDVSPGFGPGGAFVTISPQAAGAGGGFGRTGGTGNTDAVPGSTYGNDRLLPLTGGSGGSAARDVNGSGSGGAGGGAILIGSNGSINVSPLARTSVRGGTGGDGAGSRGDGGSGAGGGIRLMAEVITVQSGAVLIATGGSGRGWGGRGGDGRIRFDANTFSIATKTTPAHTSGPPEFIFPPVGRPIIRTTTLGTMSVPADPVAGLDSADADVSLAVAGMADLLIDAVKVPITATITVRLTPKVGQAETVNAIRVSGDDIASTWTASVPLLPGATAIQVRAELP